MVYIPGVQIGWDIDWVLISVLLMMLVVPLLSSMQFGQVVVPF